MSDALRVGIFLPTLRGGGAERNMLRLAEGLVARGMRVTVVVADERGPLRGHVPADATFVNLGARILALSLVPFIRWLRTRPVDVVIAAINGANVVALAGRSLSGVDVPIIVSERNTLSEWRTDGWSPDRRWIIPWLVRRLYPRAEAIVAVSQATADDLSNFTGIDGARIDVVEGGEPLGGEPLGPGGPGPAHDDAARLRPRGLVAAGVDAVVAD
ncbi:MAG: glycosyltransferase, partial [Phycisphaeraceae bacterium]